MKDNSTGQWSVEIGLSSSGSQCQYWSKVLLTALKQVFEQDKSYNKKATHVSAVKTSLAVPGNEW